MGIINRTKDASEQKEALKVTTGAAVNSTEFIIAAAERPMTISKVVASCIGISGAPTGLLRVTRFGGASYFIGASFLIPAVGTSGVMGVSLPATGSSLLLLQKNDLLTVAVGGGTSAAANSVLVEVVVQNAQDIKGWF